MKMHPFSPFLLAIPFLPYGSAAPPPTWAFSDVHVSGLSLVVSSTFAPATTNGPLPLQDMKEVAKGSSSDSVFYTEVECKYVTGVEWCAIAPSPVTNTGFTNSSVSQSTTSGSVPYPTTSNSTTPSAPSSSSSRVSSRSGTGGGAHATSQTASASKQGSISPSRGFKTSVSANSTSASSTGSVQTPTGSVTGSQGQANSTASQTTSKPRATGTISMSQTGSQTPLSTSNATQASTSLPWSAAGCNTPAATDASLNQTERWDDVDTPDAWSNAIDSWNNKPSSNSLSFSQQIANYLHGPEQMLCDQLSARDGCASDVACKTVGHPANAFILNSFVAISDLNWNIYDSISKAQGQVTNSIGPFTSTFAPIDDPDAGLKVMLDVLGLGFALFAAPVWNIALKSLSYFKKPGMADALGAIKDTVNPIVSNGVTITKDAGLSGAILQANNDIAKNLGIIVQGWYTTLDVYNNQLFNGSAPSIDQLAGQIQDGKVLEADFQEDELDIQNSMERAIYGYLIPQAWSLSNEDIHPVVVDGQAPCGTVDPQKKYIEPSVGDATFICYNNNIYYLLMAKGSNWSCDGSGPDVYCTYYKLEEVQGFDTLDGQQWGGIIKDDLIKGAVNSFTKNGQTNGGQTADPTDMNVLSDIFDNGVSAAGVVNIPVCSAKEAMDNWTSYSDGKKQSAHYPCN